MYLRSKNHTTQNISSNISVEKFSICLLAFFLSFSAPAATKESTLCKVKNLSFDQNESIDSVSLNCAGAPKKAYLFSESHKMFLERAQREGRSVKVKFEPMDKKRLALGEVLFH